MSNTERNSTVTAHVEQTGPVQLSLSEVGEGRPVLLLHGGAGPQSVAGFARLLAAEKRAHVIVPTHPGFAGTPRPEGLTTVRQLARLYSDLLHNMGLGQALVVGNSVGGWVAAEMALLGAGHLGGVVLVDAIGIDVPEHPLADFFNLTPEQVAQAAYHDPDRFRVDPASLPPEARAEALDNRATLALYSGGPAMVDPGLWARLAAVRVPVLVAWGESDRVCTPGYGRAFADAIPGARFELMAATGHLPQLESPGPLLDIIWSFAEGLETESC